MAVQLSGSSEVGGESCQGISWDNAHHKEVGESGCFLKLSLVRACLSFLSIKPVEQHPE